MATIEIDISNQAIADAIGQTALAKLQNPEPLYRIWAARIDSVVVGAFRAQSEPYTGTAWPELSPVTQMLQPRRRGTLRVTGALFDSFVVVPESDGIRAGFNQRVGEYNLGAIHQFGATVPITPRSRAFFWHRFNATQNQGWKALGARKADSVRIPPRRMLPLQSNGEPMPELVEDLRNLTLRWLLS